MTRRKLPRRASLGYLMQLHIVQFTNGPTNFHASVAESVIRPLPVHTAAESPAGSAPSGMQVRTLPLAPNVPCQRSTNS
jgi:hypothetical protein